MPNVCSSYACKNRSDKTQDISYFSFPLDNKELLQKWVVNMKRDKWYPTKASRLCSLHFEDKFIYQANNKRRLLAAAIPTKFSFPPHLVQKEAKRRRSSAKSDQGNSSQDIEEPSYKRRAVCNKMPMCSAIQCSYQRWKSKNTKKSVHRFPFSRPEMVTKWLINMKRKDWHPTRWSVLCSDHFEDSCFDRTGPSVRLHPDAVPTIFNFPKHLQKKQNCRKPPATRRREAEPTKNRKRCKTYDATSDELSTNNETQPSDTEHDQQSSTLLFKIKEEPPDIIDNQSPIIEPAAHALQLRIENTRHVDSWEPDDDGGSSNSESPVVQVEEVQRRNEISGAGPSVDDSSSNSDTATILNINNCHNYAMKPHSMNHYNHIINHFVKTNQEVRSDQICLNGPSFGDESFRDYPHTVSELICELIKLRKQRIIDKKKIKLLQQNVTRCRKRITTLEKFFKCNEFRYTADDIAPLTSIEINQTDISEDEHDDTLDLLEEELEENELFTIFHMP